MHVGWQGPGPMAAPYQTQWTPMTQIKTEAQDMPISEGFHSGESTVSRDSNPNSPRSVDSGDSHTMYYDTPSASLLHYRPIPNMAFNPLTPPGFDHPKLHLNQLQITQLSKYHQHMQYHHHMKSELQNFPQMSPEYHAKEIPHSLTPRYSPPLNVTPPKSPKSPCMESKTPDISAHSESGESENYDHIQSLQMDTAKDNNNDSGDEVKSDIDDEIGLRTPTVNSHGKVKTFKCKQCEFVAVTKMNFWEHTKQHIKPEKMLKCSKCPFVTEYKHHLEYHLRNHSGSKPFQCDKCSYSCVNKSMLNSHLKSHSNIYQYRCSNCNYATKYCHSLKLHLRKYSHKPAMVLNQDGTPNPLPIIDVYGTRRGPKPRTNPKEEQTEVPAVVPSQSPPPSQMFQNPFAMMGPNLNLPFPYGSLMNSFPNFQNLLFNGNMDTRESPEPDILKPQDLSPRSKGKSLNKVPESRISDAALDLTQIKPDIRLPITIPTPVTPTVSSKSRRKGRAVKLERMAAMNTCSSDEEFDSPIKIPTVVENLQKLSRISQSLLPTPPVVVVQTRVAPPEESAKPETVEPKVIASFECRFCDISFRDAVLHTMHMGYHGFSDPYTCNMCGEQCDDRVNFFLHIARNPHT